MPRPLGVLAIAIFVGASLVVAFAAASGTAERTGRDTMRASTQAASGTADRTAVSSDSSCCVGSRWEVSIKPAVLSAFALAKALLRAASAVIHAVAHTTKLVLSALT